MRPLPLLLVLLTLLPAAAQRQPTLGTEPERVDFWQYFWIMSDPPAFMLGNTAMVPVAALQEWAGQPIPLPPGTRLVSHNDLQFAPLRTVAASLGAELKWVAPTNAALLTFGDKRAGIMVEPASLRGQGINRDLYAAWLPAPPPPRVPSHQELQELMVRAGQGNQAALGQLMALTSPTMRDSAAPLLDFLESFFRQQLAYQNELAKGGADKSHGSQVAQMQHALAEIAKRRKELGPIAAPQQAQQQQEQPQAGGGGQPPR